MINLADDSFVYSNTNIVNNQELIKLNQYIGNIA